MISTLLNVTSQGVNSRSPGPSYKVAKIRAPGLPRFSLGTNSALRTMENVVDKIVGASKSIIEVDARQYPEFSAHFWIRGSDPAAVIAFLSAEKTRFLEAGRRSSHECKLSRVF